MTSIQRYVSKELAHFAGQGKPGSEQYDTLLAILRSGTLLASNAVQVITPEGSPPLPPSYELLINPNEPVGEKFRGNVVCFCDIPVEDLGIHTGKYSRFGLSFLKDFLVPRGASPVFYLDNQAPVQSLIDSLDRQPASREQIFDIGQRLTNELLHELQFGTTEPSGERSEPWAKEGQDMFRVSDIRNFLGYHIFAFLKPSTPPPRTLIPRTSTWSVNGASLETWTSRSMTSIGSSCRRNTPAAFEMTCRNTPDS